MTLLLALLFIGSDYGDNEDFGDGDGGRGGGVFLLPTVAPTDTFRPTSSPSRAPSSLPTRSPTRAPTPPPTLKSQNTTCNLDLCNDLSFGPKLKSCPCVPPTICVTPGHGTVGRCKDPEATEEKSDAKLEGDAEVVEDTDGCGEDETPVCEDACPCCHCVIVGSHTCCSCNCTFSGHGLPESGVIKVGTLVFAVVGSIVCCVAGLWLYALCSGTLCGKNRFSGTFAKTLQEQKDVNFHATPMPSRPLTPFTTASI